MRSEARESPSVVGLVLSIGLVCFPSEHWCLSEVSSAVLCGSEAQNGFKMAAPHLLACGVSEEGRATPGLQWACTRAADLHRNLFCCVY